MASIGKCKLTGQTGRFVKAHLIPRALTRLDQPGTHFIQASGIDGRPSKRFDSWYDPFLVIQKGENILRDYDEIAIKELRRLKLVWSGWDDATRSYNGSDLTFLPEEILPGRGMRTIENYNGYGLRLFFLSLLWRAAASDRGEFRKIQLPLDELDRLREMVLTGSTSPADFYPISVIQIIERGPAHNFVPILIDENGVGIDGKPHRTCVFRFYLDGLIVWFYRPDCNRTLPELGNLVVGSGPKLSLLCIPIAESLQFGNLSQLIAETHLAWPKTMAKLSTGESMDYDKRLAHYRAIFGAKTQKISSWE